MSLVPRLNPKRLPPNQCPPVPPKCPLSPVLNPKRLNDLLSRKVIEVGANVTPVPSDSVSWILRPRWLQEMAKGAAGADGRGDAYGALARHVADIFRHRLRRVSVMTPSGSDFGCVRIGVRNNEQFLDVSWCFWGFGWTSTFQITVWAFDDFWWGSDLPDTADTTERRAKARKSLLIPSHDIPAARIPC